MLSKLYLAARCRKKRLQSGNISHGSCLKAPLLQNAEDGEDVNYAKHYFLELQKGSTGLNAFKS